MKTIDKLTKEFQKKLASQSTDYIQEILSKAYDEGFRAGIYYFQNPPKPSRNIQMRSLSLDLPSGTVWTCPKNHSFEMRMRDIAELKYKIPTSEQVRELSFCYFKQTTKSWYLYNEIIGLSGANEILSKYDVPLVVPIGEKMDSEFRVHCFIQRQRSSGIYQLIEENVYAGESCFPLFVL